METLASDPYFDLIITDIMMPYMTGFEFAAKLKEYVGTRDIPLIATSAFHDWEKAGQEHELKVDGFVPKPIDRIVSSLFCKFSIADLLYLSARKC